MACALIFAFTIIGLVATHAEQRSLDRIESGLRSSSAGR